MEFTECKVTKKIIIIYHSLEKINKKDKSSPNTYAVPLQIPTKSLASPIFCPFLWTVLNRTWSEGEADLERIYNGTTTVLQRNCIKRKPEHFSRLFIVFQAYRKPEINACRYVIETVSRLYFIPVLCITASLSLF